MSARWGKGAPDGGSRQHRGRSRGSALAAVGVSSESPSCRILRRRSSAAGCSSRSQRSSFPATLPGRHRAGRRARSRRRSARRDLGASPSAAFGPSSEVASTPQLAGVYAGQVDPARCFVSEKYDGVRALWDGRVLRHRSGRAVSAPPSFIAVLAGGRRSTASSGSAAAASTRSRRASVAPSRTSATGATCATWCSTRRSAACPSRRVWRVSRPLAPRLPARVEVAPQWRVADRAELEQALARTIAAGGEGLMLHVADAAYVARTQRSAAEAEAASRRRGGRRRSPRGQRKVPRARRRARGRDRRRAGASSSAAASTTRRGAIRRRSARRSPTAIAS